MPRGFRQHLPGNRGGRFDARIRHNAPQCSDSDAVQSCVSKAPLLPRSHILRRKERIQSRLDRVEHHVVRLESRDERRLDVVDLRPISKWDIDRVLETVPVPIEANRPTKLRIFRHDSLLDVFIADRATLTHRLYSHRGGQIGLEFRDTAGCVTNLLARRLK